MYVNEKGEAKILRNGLAEPNDFIPLESVVEVVQSL